MIDRTTDAVENFDGLTQRATGGSSPRKLSNGIPKDSARGWQAKNIPNPSDTRTAFVHDWLPVIAGAERVLEQMLSVFPNSEVFTLIDNVSDEGDNFLADHPVNTSFIQRMPFGPSKYRYYLPLAPMAIEQFDLRDYELVISSNYAVAKGVVTSAEQLHVSYTHSPIRYAWDLYFDYVNESSISNRVKRMLAKMILHYVRLYDTVTAKRVDGFIANSEHVARRIWKTYRQPSRVVHPPVNTSQFPLYEQKEDFYLTLSRLVPYKRIDLIVETFSHLPGKELVVVGDGPQFDRLQSIAGPNVTMLGYQPLEAVQYYMQRARAFVFAAEEDFGIVPLEAQACGTPVIAYGRGGALETVVPGKTGVLFDDQSQDSLSAAITAFEKSEAQFEPGAIREHAMKFSVPRFQEEFLAAVQEYQYQFKQFGPSMTERLSLHEVR